MEKNMTLEGPRKQRTPIIRTRLATSDYESFCLLMRIENKNMSVIAREAVVNHINAKQSAERINTERELEIRIRKLENRFAGLMARTGIDVCMILMLMWKFMDKPTRDETAA
jgi:hypothetical protein